MSAAVVNRWNPVVAENGRRRTIWGDKQPVGVGRGLRGFGVLRQAAGHRQVVLMVGATCRINLYVALVSPDHESGRAYYDDRKRKGYEG